MYPLKCLKLIVATGVIVFADSSGVWRLDEDGTSTLIRSDVEVTRTWTQIALPNGNKQLYMSHVTFNTIRGTSKLK